MTTDDELSNPEHFAEWPLPQQARLVAWIREGKEPEASNALAEIGHLFTRLMRRGWRRAGGPLEDFVQDVLWRLVREVKKPGSEVRALAGLMESIVAGAAADYWRSQAKHEKNRDPVDLQELEIEAPELAPPIAVIGVFTRQLPPREREVVELTIFGDLSTGQIASILGVQEGSVRMTKTRALRHLRELLLR